MQVGRVGGRVGRLDHSGAAGQHRGVRVGAPGNRSGGKRLSAREVSVGTYPVRTGLPMTAYR